MAIDAREYMHNIRRIRRRIRSLQEQIERDRNLATGATAIRYDRDKIQTSPVGDRMTEIVNKIIETTHKLEIEIQTFQLMEEEALAVLSNLKDEHERVLTYHYIDNLDMHQISIILGYNERYIYEIKDRALDELQKVINESSE